MSALAVSVALFAIALTMFVVVGPAHPRTRTVGVDELRGGNNRRAQTELIHYLEEHGATNCQPYVPWVDKTATYASGARAIAAVDCDAVGTGPDTVVGYRFADDVGLKAWELDNHNYVAGTNSVGVCDEGGGETPWADASGRILGNLFCEPSGGKSHVAWSVASDHSGYAAHADAATMETLLTWWERNIRGLHGDRPSAIAAIHRAFDNYVQGQLRGCRSHVSALADAAIACGESVPTKHPKSHVSTLQVFHFPTSRALDAYFKSYAAAFRAPSNNNGEFCDKATLVKAPYYHRSTVAGRIFCFPYDTSQWIVWTMDDQKLAALIGRDDQKAMALYRIWADLPG